MAKREERAVERHIAFWDTSALVPLCLRQTATPRVSSLYKKYQAVVWWGTSVELASALARLLRMKQLDPSDWAKARQAAMILAEGWLVIQPSVALRSRACGLVDRYDLHAADSLQLAAALEWCSGVPTGKVFLAADQRLRDAAALSGFDGKRI